MNTHEPVFNVPAIVTGLLALIVGVHVAREFMSPETGDWFVALMAFIPSRYSGEASELPGGATAGVTSFLTHMFVHGDIVHLIFNSAWLLAFGGAIAKRIGALRFILFFALTGIAGALLFLVFNMGLNAPVVGASGAISGLMGGTMRFLFSALDDGGVAQLRDHPRSVRLMTLKETLADRRVQFATATWLIVNALAAIGINAAGETGAIAWEAHIGGYMAGLISFGWFDLANAKSNETQPIIH